MFSENEKTLALVDATIDQVEADLMSSWQRDPNDFYATLLKVIEAEETRLPVLLDEEAERRVLHLAYYGSLILYGRYQRRTQL
jgi:hypothetical protein